MGQYADHFIISVRPAPVICVMKFSPTRYLASAFRAASCRASNEARRT